MSFYVKFEAIFIYIFFFQAEDGIRDLTVTGVQTCALPIWGGGRVRLDRLIALIGRTLGQAPEVERCPDQPGDVRLTAADLRRAEAELGYRPRVGIEEGIRQFVRWYEATHGRQS